MKLILRIKERRMESYLSQTQLAEMIGVHKAQVNRLETGKSDNPPILTLIKIARALKCNIDDLYEIVD